MKYEELLEEAYQNGILVKELPLLFSDGRCKGKRIAIRSDIPTLAQKASVLAEELGHYFTTTGRIVEENSVNARKQEHIARLWAYDRQIGLSGIILGYKNHCRNRFELADFLGVTEEFLQETIDCYKSKYGCSVDLNGYTILFEPSLAVIEKV